MQARLVVAQTGQFDSQLLGSGGQFGGVLVAVGRGAQGCGEFDAVGVAAAGEERLDLPLQPGDAGQRAVAGGGGRGGSVAVGGLRAGFR
nr:hypothetical protein [Nocardia gipuzkoensis]